MAFTVMAYVPGDTPVHRCDARVKIVVLLAFSIAVLLVRTWWGMAAFTAAVLVAAAVARLSPRLLNRMLVPVYVLAAFSVLFNVLASPTPDGLAAGLFLAVRMIILVLASFVMCLTSSSSELLEAFSWFIGPLRKVGVPVDDVSFTLALALRFIPLVEQEFHIVNMAQRARGARQVGSFSRKLRIWGAAFSAVFVGLFRRADTMGDAMDARCYGASRQRTRLGKLQ